MNIIDAVDYMSLPEPMRLGLRQWKRDFLGWVVPDGHPALAYLKAHR